MKPRVLWWYIFAWLAAYSLLFLSASLTFHSWPDDGAIQIMNPMRRISAGLPFVYFHGKGLPYLHYPFFVLLGQSPNAAEAATYIVSLGLFVVSTFLVAFLALREGKAVFIVLILALSAWLTPALIAPEASLFGTRSAFPIIAFAFLMSRLPSCWKLPLAGVSTGLALFFSSEQGLVWMAGVTAPLAALIVFKAGSRRSNAVFLASFLAIAVAVCAGLLVVSSGGLAGAATNLHYNYVELIEDHYWFFGVPPRQYVASLLELFSPREAFLLPFVILVGLVGWSLQQIWRTPAASLNDRHVAYLMLSLYALATMNSFMGIAGAKYTQLPWRVIITILGLELIRCACAQRDTLQRFWHRLRRTRPQRLFIDMLTALSMIILALQLLIPTRTAAQQFAYRLEHDSALSVNHAAHVAQITGAIDQLYSGDPAQMVLWSTFAGLTHEHYGLFNPAEDFIFHVLGEERRRAYVEQFRTVQPDFVEIVPRPGGYGNREWLYRSDWEFFEQVLLNYELAAASGLGDVWHRQPGEWVSPDSTACDVYAIEDDNWELPAQYATSERGYGIVVVSVTYRIHNPLESLPLVGSWPRYFVVADQDEYSPHPVSLPPYRTEHAFPLVFTTDRPTLAFHTVDPLGVATYQADQVCIRAITPSRRTDHFFFRPDAVPDSASAPQTTTRP